MTWQDAINGLLFEGCSAVLLWLNVRRLLVDRHVAGVDWRVTAFFAVWGVWNVYYYTHLGQWASAGGALLVAGANGAWVLLAVRLGRVAAR